MITAPAIQLSTVMTPQEAQAAVSEARQHLTDAAISLTSAYQLVLDLKQRGGAEALGYSSFNQLYEAEFKDLLSRSRSTYYRLLAYVDTVAILPGVSPTGDNLPSERSVRPLYPLPEDGKVAVWESASMRAGEGQPTSTLTEEERYRWQVENHEPKFSPVIQWMRSGDLAPKQAYKLCNTLMECAPKVRGDMLRWGITTPALIASMNKSRKSEGYQEAIQEGGFYTGEDETFIPLKEATAAQWREYMNYRQQQRIRANLEATLPAPVSILTYPSEDEAALKASAEELRKVWGDKLDHLIAYLKMSQERDTVKT